MHGHLVGPKELSVGDRLMDCLTPRIPAGLIGRGGGGPDLVASLGGRDMSFRFSLQCENTDSYIKQCLECLLSDCKILI